MQSASNTLAREAEENRWNLVKRPWIPATSEAVPDFPRISVEDLKILFTGTYQLSQSVSYLAEMLEEDNTVNLKIHRDNSNVLKLEVQSRHIKSKTYRCYIDYEPRSTRYTGIRRYNCECANGTRTVGCCFLTRAISPELSDRQTFWIQCSTMAPEFSYRRGQ